MAEMSRNGAAPGTAPERGLIMLTLPQGEDPAPMLLEMEELLRTAGVDTVATIVQHRDRPHPSTYLGPGKLRELKELAERLSVEVIVCDDELTPRQQRRLEDELQSRVVDRTAVILDIFAQHAHTAEGKLQVELAQLEYNLQRMRGMWKHLERLGGGIGTRGPGESQLESDRRMARRRITLVRGRLRDVAARRDVMRRERARNETPSVSLAGYTNVGKSTLLNALTGSHVSVNNRLFETLDPTTRGFSEGGRSYLVTDTVGFIRKLPHQLVEAFAATLEETLAGDLVLLVADASASEEELAGQLQNVRDVLDEIEAEEIPQLLVLNKVDLVDEVTRRRLANRNPDAVLVSARTGEGLDRPEAAGGRVLRRPLRRRPAAAAALQRRRAVGAVRVGRADHRSRGLGRGRAGLGAASAAPGQPVRGLPRRRPVSAAVSIKRLHPDARIPSMAYAGDAGLDLSSVERLVLRPGRRSMVATGLAVAIPAGHAGFVQPRSGLAANHGIAVVNSPGLIDAGYRGELRVVLLNTDPERDFTIEVGDRIAQLVILALPAIELVEVDELPGSERAERGFGSSAVGPA